jgi:hypothetical protein
MTNVMEAGDASRYRALALSSEPLHAFKMGPVVLLWLDREETEGVILSGAPAKKFRPSAFAGLAGAK